MIDANARAHLAALKKKIQSLDVSGAGNASLLQSQNAAFYRNRANHTGQQEQSTITGLVADIEALFVGLDNLNITALRNNSGIALLASTIVQTNVAGKQLIYTVPAGFTCAATSVFLQYNGESLAGMGDDARVYFDDDVYNVAAFSGGQLASLSADLPLLLGSELLTGAAAPMGAAGAELGITFFDNSINAGLLVDVVGFLRPNEN